jgi:hypothetical protein
VIPLALTIINILFCGILGMPSIHGFIGNFYLIWVDFFFTGSFLDIVAWRWHLFLLGGATLISFLES